MQLVYFTTPVDWALLINAITGFEQNDPQMVIAEFTMYVVYKNTIKEVNNYKNRWYNHILSFNNRKLSNYYTTTWILLKTLETWF